MQFFANDAIACFENFVLNIAMCYSVFRGKVMMVPHVSDKCRGVLHVWKSCVLAQVIDHSYILLFVSMATHSSPADAPRSMSAPWCNKNEVRNNIKGSEMLLIFRLK